MYIYICIYIYMAYYLDYSVYPIRPVNNSHLFSHILSFRRSNVFV